MPKKLRMAGSSCHLKVRTLKVKTLLEVWDRNGLTNGPTPRQLDDDDDLLRLYSTWGVNKHREQVQHHGKPTYLDKTCSVTMLSTTNPTWTANEWATTAWTMVHTQNENTINQTWQARVHENLEIWSKVQDLTKILSCPSHYMHN
jgi:hypothetical protein